MYRGQTLKNCFLAFLVRFQVLVHNPKEPNHTYDELLSSFVF